MEVYDIEESKKDIEFCKSMTAYLEGQLALGYARLTYFTLAAEEKCWTARERLEKRKLLNVQERQLQRFKDKHSQLLDEVYMNSPDEEEGLLSLFKWGRILVLGFGTLLVVAAGVLVFTQFFL